MDDLTALESLATSGSHWHMTDTESETQFDSLVSVETMYVQDNRLTRVPSIKNMRSLTLLLLASNQITAIFPGDFLGATRLLMLDLGGNRITSVASEAFVNLASMQVRPNEFKPTNADGTPYQGGPGVGFWPHAGLGYFGGGQEWAHVPITFSPNPVQCRWVGPLVSDLDCSCGLGYEAYSYRWMLSTDPAGMLTCYKPAFRPHRGWRASEERAQLQFQDTRGNVVKRDTSYGPIEDWNTSQVTDVTYILTLLTDQTYTIMAPMLEPKAEKFVGYKQPYSKIKYELDFSRGAEVDIGCGTSVVGNGAGDPYIPKYVYAHPLSMHTFSFQCPIGRGNLNADPPDYGYYPTSCPRYHRFRVTRPGNFTLVRTFAWKCYSRSLSLFFFSRFSSSFLPLSLAPPSPASTPPNVFCHTPDWCIRYPSCKPCCDHLTRNCCPQHQWF